jgi:heme exporter protein A
LTGDTSIVSLRLVLEKLTVDYASSRALDGVTMSIEGGESVAVYGSNGSGKSTLLWAMSGLLLPSSGARAIHGRGASGGQPRIGFLAHASFLYDDLTVEENLYLAARLNSAVDPAREAADWIARLGLEPQACKRIASLSRGQAQRASFARAVMADPDVVLLDEPFANLDEAGVSAVSASIESIRASGRIVVSTSHARGRLSGGATREIELAAGRVSST